MCVLALACGQVETGAPRSPVSSTRGDTTPRGAITIGWAREPESLSPKFLGSAGTGEAAWVFNSSLAYYDFHGAPHPMIAQRIPTSENGDWVVNADGTMVTIYRLRAHARWHDGAPLTAHDFVFAHRVYTDPDVASTSREPERLMASVEAPDDATLIIHWAEPYIHANVLTRVGLPPLPRHLLEEKYRASRASFTSGEEWTSGFVGSGPFRLERWEPGSRIVARAHADWLLGPPKLETVEIRFLSDPNALLANLMAGEVDFATSPAIRLQDGLAAREQWVARDQGYLKTWATRLKFLEFQYREVPSWQRAVTDVRVRQALAHALDREGLAHAMTDGLSPLAEAFVLPSDPFAPEVSLAITRYPFDPQRATALLAEAGWRPGSGGLLTNALGQPLDVEVSSGSSEPQAAAIIADNWKAARINSSVFILPLARQRDREFRASFPATSIGERSVWLGEFTLISSRIPTAESGWAEFNRGSFSDFEVDRFHNLAVTSFDENVRRQATISLHRRLSEIAAYVPLYFGVEVLLARNRLRGPVGNYGPEPGVTWNIFEWEVVP